MADLTPEALLRAQSLEELGELARELGLGEALHAPMIRVLGLQPKAGRMKREVERLVAALGTDDVQALLVDAPEHLEARPMQGVRKKLFEHARTYLYEAARAEAEGPAPTSEPLDPAEEAAKAGLPPGVLRGARAAGLEARPIDAVPSARSATPEPARAEPTRPPRPGAEARAQGGAKGAPRTAAASPGRVAGAAASGWLEAGADASPARAGATPDRPTTKERLRAWARERGVTPLLSARIFATLSDDDPRLFAQMIDPKVENAPFEDVLVPGALGAASARLERRLEELRAAAWAYLEREAEVARRGIEEEPDWAARARPDDEARVRLIEALLERRARVRADLAPRPKDAVRAHHLEVEPGEAPAAIYVEEATSRLAFPVKVTLRLDPSGTLELRSTHSGGELDPYVISALDLTLEALFDPEDPRLDPLVDAIRHPPWRRGLDALIAAGAPLAGDGEEDLDGPLGWWVSLEPRLDLRPVVQKRKRSGALGRPRPVALERVLDARSTLAPVDAAVVELLDLAEIATRRSAEDALKLRVRALERLAGRPRIFFGEGEAPGTLERAALGLRVSKAQGDLLIEPHLGGFVLPIHGLASHRAGEGAGSLVYAWPDEATLRFDVLSPATERALEVLARYPRAWPEEAQEALVEALPALERLGPVSFEASVPRRRVPAQPTLVLRLDAEEERVRVKIRARLLEAAPLVVPGEGPDEIVAARPDRTLVYAPRNLASERAWAEAQLRALLDEVEGLAEGYELELVGPEPVFALLDRARELEGVVVQWAERGWRIAQAFTEDLRVEVKDRRDWFGLGGGLDVDGRRVELALLLDAAREGRSYVELGPGDFVRIEASIMERLAALAPAAHTVGGEVRVGSAAAEPVEALGELAAELEVCEGWKIAQARFEAARALEPELPPGLQAELRPYQRAGFEWMARLSTWGLGACLADDMGLGKTLQTLSVLLYRAQEGPQLVIAPTSVTFNWAREAARFTPDLEVRTYAGPSRAAALEDLGPGAVVITSYGLATRDAEVLAEAPWATLVLDEAQAIKNAQSQRSQALRTIPAEWRLALSGTPIENRLSELWSLFRVVEPSLLGSWAQFKDRFAGPIERDGDTARAEDLSRLIRPFVLRRTKREVAPELPPRTDVDVDVALGEAQRALYEDARLATLAKLEEARGEGEAGRFQVLAALTRLRQLACHPRLDDDQSAVPGAKLERLMHLVRDLVEEGQSALIFSQFVGHLALVREALDAAGLGYLYLDGQTPTAARAEAVDAFQRGRAPLFLISLKAGGTGLNLTAADNVILLDPWWNPSVEDQATDRAHRIGREQPVTVYRLVSRDTVEDAILALHRDKRALVSQILDGTGAAASLGVDELVGLIRGG